MFNFSLSFFFVILSSTSTTTVQPYKATDRIFLDCGSSGASYSNSNYERWDGDERSKFMPSNFTTTSFSSTPDHLDSSVPEIPYSTARIISTSFTYTFPISKGPKFLRLHFYPAIYSDINTEKPLFNVSSNGYSLLTNFSAFLAVSHHKNTRTTDPRVLKEFLIYVKDAQILNVTFTPSSNSYAFINGIEIISMPEHLYFDATGVKYVNQVTGPVITNDTALENIYRLNMGGGQISSNNDTGMYRSWDRDNSYIYGAAIGLTPTYNHPIMYTMERPNYTAPELVYQTQRSMGNMAHMYNLTWILPVDSGFYYLLRLHFCNIIPLYTKQGEVLFTIFISNQTAEEEADLFYWTKGTGYPVFKDYIVLVHDHDGSRSKQDLWLAVHPNTNYELYGDAYLNGLEVFKLSNDKSLASPNPQLTDPTTSPTGLKQIEINGNRKAPYAAIIGGTGGALVLLSILIILVFQQRRPAKDYGDADDKSSHGPAYSESKSTKSTRSTLPSDRCRRFSLTELKEATDEFNDNFIIGNGGFGKVYKGHIEIDNTTSIVAIKRLDSLSTQGFQEFRTEIGLLSKLRHVQLVSLIGYCNDEGEMILVYDYMAHGTIREHLYKTNKPPLSWKRRLDICIGAAKGLHYLHTGAKHAIIHRDVKSTNILLDENWVAKVSDFGFSEIGPKDQLQKHVSTVVKGSIGYVDPQYYRTQQLTEKSDVYSFGVVLLEVLCARPVMNPGQPKKQVSLAEWSKLCYRKGTLHKIIDPNLGGVIAPECLRQFAVVAVSCLRDQGIERPTMDEVVWGLEFALELQEAAEKTVANVTNITDEDAIINQPQY